MKVQRKGISLVLFIVGVILLGVSAVSPLSSVPYTKTEYWKVEKTINPATSGINLDYQKIYECDKNYNPTDYFWLPMLAGETKDEVQQNLINTLSSNPVQSVISSNEDSNYYYFTVSRRYWKNINGEIKLTTYEDDNTLYQNSVDYHFINTITKLGQICHSYLGSLEIELPSGSYIIWATIDDGRKSSNVTINVVDGGSYNVKLILSSSDSTTPPSSTVKEQTFTLERVVNWLMKLTTLPGITCIVSGVIVIIPSKKKSPKIAR